MLQFDVADIIPSSITPTTDEENIWHSKPDSGKAFLSIGLNSSITNIFKLPVVGGNNTVFQVNVNKAIESIKRILGSYKSKHS